jgi:predicted Rdx family selenoprotein
MVEQFETFLNFNDEDLARFVAEKLKDNNVEFIVEKSKPLLDASLVDTSIDRNIHIKLRRQDFQKGDQALEDYYKAQLTNIDSEYYLLSFSDDELKDVITKPDEWGHFNYQLAQKLLKERGHDIEESMLSKLKADRIKDLAQPEKASRLLLFFGYCFIPFGLIVGFLIGRHLFHSKKPLPNGQLVFSYTEADRKHGNRIMIITGVIFILSIVFWAIMLIKDS